MRDYEEMLKHRDRLLSDIVADDFPYVMGELRREVVRFVTKNPTFKEKASKDFKINFK